MSDAPLGYLSGPPDGPAVRQYESGPVPSQPEGGEPEATCGVCGGPLWEGNPDVWVHHSDQDSHEGRPEGCRHVVSWGSPNPESPRFGPDEFCENYATFDSEFCSEHGE